MLEAAIVQVERRRRQADECSDGEDRKDRARKPPHAILPQKV
jgi:hypothetical protein